MKVNVKIYKFVKLRIYKYTYIKQKYIFIKGLIQ